jgi:hypothetical protein
MHLGSGATYTFLSNDPKKCVTHILLSTNAQAGNEPPQTFQNPYQAPPNQCIIHDTVSLGPKPSISASELEATSYIHRLGFRINGGTISREAPPCVGKRDAGYRLAKLSSAAVTELTPDDVVIIPLMTEYETDIVGEFISPRQYRINFRRMDGAPLLPSWVASANNPVLPPYWVRNMDSILLSAEYEDAGVPGGWRPAAIKAGGKKLPNPDLTYYVFCYSETQDPDVKVYFVPLIPPPPGAEWNDEDR